VRLAWSAASSSPGWRATATARPQDQRARPARYRGAAGARHRSVDVFIHTGDLAAPGATASLVASRPDAIFHLAGIVSGEAEANFDLGYRVNLDGTRALFDAVRLAAFAPRLVFTSSIAVFGAPFPDVIRTIFIDAADFLRHAEADERGAACRLHAARLLRRHRHQAADHLRAARQAETGCLGILSGIIREPLSGQEAILPVPRSVLHTHASPRSAVNFLIPCAEIEGAAVGPRRNVTMPGVAVTVGEQIEALQRIAGDKAVKLIHEQPTKRSGRSSRGGRRGSRQALTRAWLCAKEASTRSSRPYRG